jgi:hypothetical protein
LTAASAALRAALCALALAAGSGCVSGYERWHEIQWSSSDQILLSEASQVRVRAAQSRAFDTQDRLRTLEAVVQILQDMRFQIDVLDEEIGVVSGRKFVPVGGPAPDVFYHLYESDSLMIFSGSYRTWGPFRHRSDLVRLTVTVRDRNERQLIVRASGQYFLAPIEDPAAYQPFFRTLEQALFLDAHTPE